MDVTGNARLQLLICQYCIIVNKVKACVSRHLWNGKMVSITGAGRLQKINGSCMWPLKV